VPQVAQFLLHLYDKGRCPQTLEQYKSVIGQTLESSGLTNISLDKDLRRLLNNLYREYAQKPPKKADWDLRIVLEQLRKPPFEPLEENAAYVNDSQYAVSMQHLTWKTVFLVLLATGARRGEVHALVRKGRVVSLRGNTWTFKTVYQFLSKTHTRTRGATAVRSIRIRGMMDYLGPDLYDSDCHLDPARCLRVYMKRTKSRAHQDSRLFLPTQAGRPEPVSVNTITGWVRSLITFCYEHCDDETATAVGHGTSAHAIRGLAATLACRGGASLDYVMSQCHWRSANTFIDHYLKPEWCLEEVDDEEEPINRLRVVAGGQLCELPSA
jgi:integrase